jgi:uncharacterized protein YyaL (SSP411 family)
MLFFRQPAAPPVVCFLAALVFPAVAHADDIRWRSDYAKALKEAVETDRPLLLNVGTENCYWCKQLDARTFKDAEIVKLLNDRFIPLKVDGDRNTYLVQALKIQSYPTLVFASADGNILGFKEGFVEADKLQPQMARVLAAVGVPQWMRKDLDDATKAVAAGQYARALTLLQGIVEDGKNRPIQARARKALKELETKAADAMAQARGLAEKGKKTEAVAALAKMEKAYPGTLASRQGKQLRARLTSRQEAEDERPKKAKQLLAEAKQDLEDRAYLRCLDRCAVLTSQYADLPEGAAADKMAAEIKGNTEWAKQAADQLGDRLAELYLSLADSSIKKAQPQQAVYYLERVVKLFPASKHAAAARTRLAQLRGAPE